MEIPVGSWCGDSVTTQASNTLLGFYAGQSNNDCNYNNMIGSDSLVTKPIQVDIMLLLVWRGSYYYNNFQVVTIQLWDTNWSVYDRSNNVYLGMEDWERVETHPPVYSCNNAVGQYTKCGNFRWYKCHNRKQVLSILDIGAQSTWVGYGIGYCLVTGSENTFLGFNSSDMVEPHLFFILQ